MPTLLRSRATVSFGLLLVVTGLAFWLGSGRRGSESFVWTGVVILAGVKARLILLDFMELRTAPWRLRIAAELVLVVLVAVLVTLDAVVS